MINIPGLISVIIFYLALLILGLWAGKKSRRRTNHSQTEQVLLAGRDIGIFVGIFTMTATWVGGGFINGTSEIINTPGYGLVWCIAPVGYSLCLVSNALFFTKTMRERNYVTLLDPFEERYGPRMTGILSIPNLMGDVFWAAAILSALGATLAVILGISMQISVIVSACVVTIYTVFGGLYSVAYTDIAQLICIFFGMWLCVPFAMTNPAVAPLNARPENSTMTNPDWVGSLDAAYVGVFVDTYMLLLLGGIPLQEYYQRVLASKTARQAQIVSYAACLCCLVAAIPPVLIGAVAAQTDWNKTSYAAHVNGTIAPENLALTLPLVLQYLCPTAVSVIGLGAVSAAVMSSGDSAALAASSMFANNIYKPLFRPKASEREVVWAVRVSVFIFGIIVAAIATTVQKIYGLFVMCTDAVYVITFPQFLCTIYFKYSNTYGSLVGYIVGWLLRLCSGEPILSFPAVIKYPMYKQTGSGPGDFVQLFPFRTFIMLVSVFLIMSISSMTHYLFKTNRLPKSFDIFKCFNQPTKQSSVILQSITQNETYSNAQGAECDQS